jgi:lipopolysaccharide export LptBFGC system permease protein LptF
VPGPLERFQVVAAWVILTVWVVSFAVSVVSVKYDPPPELNALMLLIIGAAFGLTSRGPKP